MAKKEKLPTAVLEGDIVYYDNRLWLRTNPTTKTRLESLLKRSRYTEFAHVLAGDPKREYVLVENEDKPRLAVPVL